MKDSSVMSVGDIWFNPWKSMAFMYTMHSLYDPERFAIDRFTNVVKFMVVSSLWTWSYFINLYLRMVFQYFESSLHTLVLLCQTNLGQAFRLSRTTFVKMIMHKMSEPVYSVENIVLNLICWKWCNLVYNVAFSFWSIQSGIMFTYQQDNCGALSRYPYKVGDHKSPKSNQNTWKAELGHTAFWLSIIFFG